MRFDFSPVMIWICRGLVPVTDMLLSTREHFWQVWRVFFVSALMPYFTAFALNKTYSLIKLNCIWYSIDYLYTGGDDDDRMISLEINVESHWDFSTDYVLFMLKLDA